LKTAGNVLMEISMKGKAGYYFLKFTLNDKTENIQLLKLND